MKSKKKWGIGVALAVLAIGAFFFTKPVYRMAKALRAQWLVQDLYYDEYDNSSFTKIRTALQLAPYDITVLRKACEIYGQLNFTLGYVQWLQLLRHDEVTVADYGLFLDFLIQHAHPALFRPYAARLATNVRPDEIKLVLAKYYLVMENISVAKLLLKELYGSEGKTAEVCYLYGLCLLQQGWSSEQEHAAVLLQESIQMGERFRQESVKLLIKHRLLNEDDLRKIATHLKQDKLNVKQLLLAYSLEASLNQESQQVVLQKVKDEFQNSEANHKLEVARWMNRNRHYEVTTNFIMQAEVATNRDLFLVRVDAMAANGRWQELEDLFKQDIPLTREIQELFRFRIAHELGKPHVADILWDKALDLARNKPVLLWYYSGYVSRLGLSDREASVYRTLLSVTAHKRGAYLALVDLLRGAGETQKLFDLLSNMRQEYPNDDEVVNDWAYCALLLDQEVEAAGKIATAAVQQSPEVFAYRITYGLYLLRVNQAEAAMRLFEDIPLPARSDWLLEWKVVYLAVLQQNQETDRAAEVRITIPINKLKQEEARLIQVEF